MPIRIQTVSTQPNQTTIFNYEAAVLYYVVGISYFSFSFSGSDHRVKQLGLSLLSSKTQKQVQCSVVAHLQDSSGNTIYNAGSLVNLVCIAVTSSIDSNILLSNAPGMQSGGSSTVTLVSGQDATPLGIVQAVLSGWNLAYPDSSDHNVKQVQLATGVSPNQNVGLVSASAQMQDSSGHVANGTIDASVLSTTTTETGLLAKPLYNQQSAGPVVLDFGKKISNGAVLLQSYSVAYPSGDHFIKTIGGGCSNITTQATGLTLTDARAFMSDNSGNHQSDTASSITLVAFGIPS